MGLSLLLLPSLLLLFITQPTTLAKICPESCGIHSPPVRFPFGLTGNGCNYPGFNLSCNNQDQTTTLSLPNSGKFTVQFIDYLSQTIYIKDPNHCLPKRYLYDHFTLSGSPFIRETFRSYAFLRCLSNSSLPFWSLSGLRTVPCLSNEANSTVVAMTSLAFKEYGLPSTCTVINQSVEVPVPWPRWSDSDTRLTWDDPDCRSCEQDGGTCGFVGDSDSIIGCSNRPKPGLPRSAKYGIIIGVGIPGLLCLIGVACYLCSRVGLYRQQNIPNRDFSTSLPQTRIMITGLDGLTINSYPKTQLGESRRLPKPNDDTCPICLCEYQAKETLRTIPECNHYFHSDCIDEWLKINANCPLCRNSPDSSSIVTPSSSMSSSSSLASTP